MNTQTTTSFEQRIKQSTGNHKPNRHRKSHSKDPEFLAAMKLKMAARKAQNKHKKVVSQARSRRGASYDESEDVIWTDACSVNEMRNDNMREEALRQDMEDRDH